MLALLGAHVGREPRWRPGAVTHLVDRKVVRASFVEARPPPSRRP